MLKPYKTEQEGSFLVFYTKSNNKYCLTTYSIESWFGHSTAKELAVVDFGLVLEDFNAKSNDVRVSHTVIDFFIEDF